MRACASLAREVPKRNLRSFSLVSGEKEYNRDSDCMVGEMIVSKTPRLPHAMRGTTAHHGAVWNGRSIYNRAGILCNKSI